jgi:hypothetical protein
MLHCKIRAQRRGAPDRIDDQENPERSLRTALQAERLADHSDRDGSRIPVWRDESQAGAE